MTTLQNSMLKRGKKGFTLTELAIVIAVIAILIAVLVPTFTSVITNARKTAAAEEAHSSITAYTLETYDNLDDTCVIKSGDYYFIVNGGAVTTDDEYCKTVVSDISSYVTYTWQDSENESLPTIYASSTYLTSHYNEGFAATTAVAAVATLTAPSATTYYVKITYSGTSYYFSLTCTDATNKKWSSATVSTASAYTSALGTATSGTSISMSSPHSSYTVEYVAKSA